VVLVVGQQLGRQGGAGDVQEVLLELHLVVTEGRINRRRGRINRRRGRINRRRGKINRRRGVGWYFSQLSNVCSLSLWFWMGDYSSM
jgi:hypothetical protein